MSRVKKDSSLMEKMCERLIVLTESHLQITLGGLSSKLGYKNETTLRKAWKGGTFPDAEKLYILSQIQNNSGASPNIHWLITGKGAPLILPEKQNERMETLKLRLESIPASLANSLLSTVEEIEKIRQGDS